MARVALAFAYDGTSFDSYARQPGRRTVESELLESLRRVGVIRDAKSARFASGSRTDRGASAAFNVCAFDTTADPGRVVGGPRTAEGLWLLSARTVDSAFNPRHALGRTYLYFLARDPALDVDAMARAFSVFEGEHDFAAFCRREAGRETRRRVDRAAVRSRGLLLECSVAGPNFLWQQVRRMVWMAREVGRGKRTVEDIRRALAEHRGNLSLGAAPAEALLLQRVEYPFRFPRPWKASFQGAGAALAVAEVRRKLTASLLKGGRRAAR